MKIDKDMKIIDGLAISKQIKTKIKEEIINLNAIPCLAVIMVGNDPASDIYVKNKEKACNECGIKSLVFKLKNDVPEIELIELIKKLNNDKKVNGILIQLPIPKYISKNKIINLIDPNKDVDCFHPINVGKMFINEEENLILPCTPKGCMILLKSVEENLSGKKAVIIGRSNIVGKPIAQLLLNENCTISIIHSKTKNAVLEIKTADIIIAALGQPKFIKKEMIKENSIIIDVGINRLADGGLCGDVDFEDVYNKCSFITPVPKGVGPMTIVCLLENLINLFKRQKNNEINF